MNTATSRLGAWPTPSLICSYTTPRGVRRYSASLSGTTPSPGEDQSPAAPAASEGGDSAASAAATQVPSAARRDVGLADVGSASARGATARAARAPRRGATRGRATGRAARATDMARHCVARSGDGPATRRKTSVDTSAFFIRSLASWCASRSESRVFSSPSEREERRLEPSLYLFEFVSHVTRALDAGARRRARERAPSSRTRYTTRLSSSRVVSRLRFAKKKVPRRDDPSLARRDGLTAAPRSPSSGCASSGSGGA